MTEKEKEYWLGKTPFPTLSQYQGYGISGGIICYPFKELPKIGSFF